MQACCRQNAESDICDEMVIGGMIAVESCTGCNARKFDLANRTGEISS
jgi:hypothetical protein